MWENEIGLDDKDRIGIQRIWAQSTDYFEEGERLWEVEGFILDENIEKAREYFKSMDYIEEDDPRDETLSKNRYFAIERMLCEDYPEIEEKNYFEEIYESKERRFDLMDLVQETEHTKNPRPTLIKFAQCKLLGVNEIQDIVDRIKEDERGYEQIERSYSEKFILQIHKELNSELDKLDEIISKRTLPEKAYDKTMENLTNPNLFFTPFDTYINPKHICNHFEEMKENLEEAITNGEFTMNAQRLNLEHKLKTIKKRYKEKCIIDRGKDKLPLLK